MQLYVLPGTRGVIQSSQSPTALSAGYLDDTLPNPVLEGYQTGNLLPKNSLKHAQSCCADFDIGQGGEGRFTTFDNHFQDKSPRLRVEIARPSIGFSAKLIGLSGTE
jgi:hypothetical protein